MKKIYFIIVVLLTALSVNFYGIKDSFAYYRDVDVHRVTLTQARESFYYIDYSGDGLCVLMEYIFTCLSDEKRSMSLVLDRRTAEDNMAQIEKDISAALNCDESGVLIMLEEVAGCE